MKWTLLKASEELGVARETLRRGLSANGIGKKATYTTREIVDALFDDGKQSRARETAARAALLERELEELNKVLMRVEDVRKIISESFLPVRQRLIALPSEVANRCNPVDPDLARLTLQRWSDEALSLIREALPQLKP